ncbi:response regulator transcription factor [Draconibacterium sp. IB214405]|uniref:response regulator transcription factor n=1 Tax=Draconibacterium sp. IB214405 TaxID=3097352 RepID=UPI002A14E4F0|nr:response regulator transcription factor [Draconibacterium sp. IB214405]MDX8339536.1 response regulator transcription factor [Draconibacterium sp. IB214405]
MELLFKVIVVNEVMNQTESKKIVLVDDNVFCGEALNLLLNDESGFQIVAEISTLEKLQASTILPQADLVLLNAGLSIEKIIPITEFLQQLPSETATILFNAKKVDQVVVQCVMNGIKGIVWSTESMSKLIVVCNKVLAGERYLGLNESELKSFSSNPQKGNDNLRKITEREMAVLKLFAHGSSYKQIGEELNISPRTVESHKNNILAKLELGSLKELIAYAVKNNIV